MNNFLYIVYKGDCVLYRQTWQWTSSIL